MIRLQPFIAAFVVVMVILTGSAVGLSSLLAALNVRLTKLPIYAPDGLQLHSLPVALPPEDSRWTQAAPDQRMSREAVEELGTDNYLTRTYVRSERDEDGNPVVVQLHVAYYTGMIDTVPHVPERCMVGGGMEFAGDTRLVPVPLDMSRLSPDPDFPKDERGTLWTARSSITHNRVRLPRGVEHLTLRTTPFRDQAGKQTVYAGYFFIANGTVVASANDVRLFAFKLDAKYAYYLKVQFFSATVSSAEELARLAADILNDLFPEIMHRVPDWTEVEQGIYPPEKASSGSTKHA